MHTRQLLASIGFVISAMPLCAQVSGYDRDRGLVMLRAARKDLEQHYYDTTFHGVNLATHWDSAETLIRAAQSNSQMFGIIAWAVMGLEDSHTLFLPPGRVDRVQYGWDLAMVGDTCFVVDANPEVDLARDRPVPGDQVLRVGPFVPNRRDFWKISYWFQSVSPQGAVPFALRSPSGAVREVTARAKVIPGKQILDLSRGGGSDFWDLIRRAENAARELEFRFEEFGKQAVVWRMPTFGVDDREIDRAVGKIDDFPGVVLDLRGNLGGAEGALLRLLGSFTDHTDTIGTLQRRENWEPLVVTPLHPVQAKLVVIVDSRSASAAEIFASVIQMRGRGTVLGDRTWGAVMRSITYGHQVGIDRVAFYAVQVSDAAVVLADGSRLEGTGMTPREIVLPTAADLAAGRDPVLAHALSLVGVQLSAEEAGHLFPKLR